MRIILLAAGLSTRMGTQKLLMPFGKSTVFETTLQNLISSGLGRVFAVLSQEVFEYISNKNYPLDYTINHFPKRGQSSSLLLGLESIANNQDFCVMLADMPLIKSENIIKLHEAFTSMPPDKTALLPYRQKVFGHPVFCRHIWRERLKMASQDMGGKKIFSFFDDEIFKIEADDEHFMDIDTKSDYEKLANLT